MLHGFSSKLLQHLNIRRDWPLYFKCDFPHGLFIPCVTAWYKMNLMHVIWLIQDHDEKSHLEASKMVLCTVVSRLRVICFTSTLPGTWRVQRCLSQVRKDAQHFCARQESLSNSNNPPCSSAPARSPQCTSNELRACNSFEPKTLSAPVYNLHWFALQVIGNSMAKKMHHIYPVQSLLRAWIMPWQLFDHQRKLLLQLQCVRPNLNIMHAHTWLGYHACTHLAWISCMRTPSLITIYMHTCTQIRVHTWCSSM